MQWFTIVQMLQLLNLKKLKKMAISLLSACKKKCMNIFAEKDPKVSAQQVRQTRCKDDSRISANALCGL